MLHEEEKNRKLTDLLDALDFNQVRHVHVCVVCARACVCVYVSVCVCECVAECVSRSSLLALGPCRCIAGACLLLLHALGALACNQVRRRRRRFVVSSASSAFLHEPVRVERCNHAGAIPLLSAHESTQ